MSAFLSPVLRLIRLAALVVLGLMLLVPDGAAQPISGQGLLFSARAGGRGVAVDRSGNAYLLESAQPPDTNAVSGIYVTKLDPNTGRVVYRRYIGHGDGYGIAVDANGNAYVAGRTTKGDFAATRSYVTPGSGPAALVVKLDPAGAQAYAVLVGGTFAVASCIAVDAAGNAYVGGISQTPDFPTTAGAFDRTWHGGGPDVPSDGVVFKLDPSGGLAYSTFLGGGDYDAPGAIAVDAGGNAYVTGRTWSSNFPTTPGAFQPGYGADGDAFVTKFNASGSALVYSTFLGGLARDWGMGIAVDPAGNAYVGGQTMSTNFPTTSGAARAHYTGNAFDAFVAKLGASGNELVYGTYLGGGDNDALSGIALDGSGDALVTGSTISHDFPVTPGAIQVRPQGSDEAYVAKLDGAGAILYSTFLSGTAPDSTAGIAVDSAGDAYVTGWGSADFPITPGSPVTVTVPNSPASPLFAVLVPRTALAVSASASSQEGSALGSTAAIDGNPATRWSSAFSDPQWILLDLGGVATIDRVVLQWETAYARAYLVQVSTDRVSWQTISDASSGDGAIDDLRNLSATGRWVRLYGATRATGWGYSLWEFNVFGTPAAPNMPPVVTIVSPSDGTTFTGRTTFDVTANASDQDGAVASVAFYVNEVLASLDETPPFTFRYTADVGSYSVRASATDQGGASASHTIHVTVVPPVQPPTTVNLASGKPGFSSSNESAALSADRAVDGTASTRWSSAFSDPQWIYVDLGQRFSVTTAVLKWEMAYASAFDLQVSDDAATWTTIYSTSSGTGGTQTLQNLSGAGRYVRMYGRKRATQWGYSLWEIEIYGIPAGTGGDVNVAAGKRTVASSMESSAQAPTFATDTVKTTRWSSAFLDGQWIYVDLGVEHDIHRIVLRWETAYAAHYVLQASNDATTWQTVRDVYLGQAGVDDEGEINATARYVRMLALQRGTVWGVSLWEFEVYGQPGGANLAGTARVTSSSVENASLGPANGTDGSLTTRWSSAFADGQWIQLDFGAPTAVKRLVLRWETAYASVYTIQASNDGVGWRSVLRVENGDGGVDDLSVDASERYLRVLCERRATQWGSSLWEIEAYGSGTEMPGVARWKMLVLIYAGTDFNYADSAGTHHVIGEIGPEQLKAAADNATRFVTQDIPALTSGHMVPSLTIRYPGTLTRLSNIGNGFWPSPWGDTSPDLDPAFDAVMVIWQPNVIDQRTGEKLWIGTAAGLAAPMGTGQTYVAMIADAATSYGHLNVFKHEFGHSILFYFDAAGTAPKPAVENHTTAGVYVHCGTGEQYVWLDETDQNPIPNSIYSNAAGFTHDYYSGTTALASSPNECLGVTPAAWVSGGPVWKPR